MKKIFQFILILPAALLLFVEIAFGKEVVVYTSVDQIFSEPILERFQEKTGIKIRALYDVEAAKTVGLVNRLIAEKRRPKADVFWNSEVSRTIQLKKKGILAQYKSPHWSIFPKKATDPEYYWVGFGARARVLIYNTNLLTAADLPKSIFELIQPQWKGKVTIANPLFGTTAMHVAALYSSIGKARTDAYLKGLVDNDIVVVDGNSVTRDLVVTGKAHIGFTDTDDANVAIQKGQPVKIFYPDQDGIGTLLIPNTVALIKNGPNPQNGKKLIDYLLSAEVESLLAFGESAQMPLRSGVARPAHIPDISEIKAIAIDYDEVARQVEPAAKFCQQLFVR